MTWQERLQRIGVRTLRIIRRAAIGLGHMIVAYGRWMLAGTWRRVVGTIIGIELLLLWIRPSSVKELIAAEIVLAFVCVLLTFMARSLFSRTKKTS